MNASLPQARIPLGHATVGGQKVDVMIDVEWMRAFTDLLAATSAGDNTGVADLLALLVSTPAVDTVSQDASRAVDELRNELANTRGDVQALRSVIEEQAAQLAEIRPDFSLRVRVEQIEHRLN